MGADSLEHLRPDGGEANALDEGRRFAPESSMKLLGVVLDKKGSKCNRLRWPDDSMAGILGPSWPDKVADRGLWRHMETVVKDAMRTRR